MYCKKITVRDFRNVERASVEFCDGVNVLVGENAQGKTNLLESIFYASMGRSPELQCAAGVAYVV